MKKGYAKLLTAKVIYDIPEGAGHRPPLAGVFHAGNVIEIRGLWRGSWEQAQGYSFDVVVGHPEGGTEWIIEDLREHDIEYLSPLEWLAEVAE